MVRFFYKADVQQKAKILRKVRECLALHQPFVLSIIAMCWTPTVTSDVH